MESDVESGGRHTTNADASTLVVHALSDARESKERLAFTHGDTEGRGKKQLARKKPHLEDRLRGLAFFDIEKPAGEPPPSTQSVEGDAWTGEHVPCAYRKKFCGALLRHLGAAHDHYSSSFIV